MGKGPWATDPPIPVPCWFSLLLGVFMSWVLSCSQRKPLGQGTVLGQVMQEGVGAEGMWEGTNRICNCFH